MNKKLFFLFTIFFLSVFVFSEKIQAEQVTIKQATLPNSLQLLSCAENSLTHKIYCFGGEPMTNQIVEYDPVNDALQVKQSTLPSVRSGLSCAENSLTHKIYCFGGYGTPQIVEYNPSTDQLVIKQATLPNSRGGLSCAEDVSTHKIYCFGGEPSTNQIIEYNPSTDQLVIKQATLPTNRWHLSCVNSPITNKIYCFGGEPFTSQIVEYDPVNDALQIRQAVLSSSRLGLSCVEHNANHLIYCFGGFQSNLARTDQIITYDPLSDSINIRPVQLPSPRYYSSCAPNSYNSLLYCFGGYDGSYLNQIIEYSYIPPLINPPSLLDIPRVGTTVDIELSDSANPNADYLLAMSFGNTPGMTLSDNRNIPLNYDVLLQTTLFSPFSFGLYSSQSRFNNNGIGRAFWTIPNNPGFAGQDIYIGFVTVDLHNPFPQAIISISQSQKVRILPHHFTPDTNTVALWDFNEGSGDVLNDLSGNNNHGQVRGATWASGIDGTALQFDGIDDYVNVSDNPSLALSTFTIEAYVNFEGILSDTTVDTIVGKDYQYVFGIGDTVFPEHLVYSIANQPSTSCTSNRNLCDGEVTVPRNAWHHVAVQYDGQMLKTIMNGQVVSEHPAQFAPGSAPHDLSIGSRLTFLDDFDPVPVAFFKGKIDEVRISNIARY